MKKFALLSISILIALFCAKAQSYQDVLYLTNGSVVKGIIIEQIPNETIKIETADGSVFVYAVADVEKIGKEAKANLTGEPRYTYGYTRKSPVLAFCASFLVSGLGQLYNEQYGKAALFCGGFYGSYLCYVVGYNSGDADMCTLGALGVVVIGLWNMIDAPVSASRLNRENLITFNNGTSLKLLPDVAFTAPTISSRSQTATVGARMQFCF